MSGASEKGPGGRACTALGEQYLQAYAELLLCAASGDVHRIQELCEEYNIQVRLLQRAVVPEGKSPRGDFHSADSCFAVSTQLTDNFTCDYEQKTPL